MSLELFRLKNLQNRIKVVDEVFKQDTIKYIVSVNGKKRGDIDVSVELPKDRLVDEAKSLSQSGLRGKVS